MILRNKLKIDNSKKVNTKLLFTLSNQKWNPYLETNIFNNPSFRFLAIGKLTSFKYKVTPSI
jgi:hypothetical protein